MKTILAFVLLAFAAERPVYEYTCPRCHRVEVYRDGVPQWRVCTGTERKPHPQQKMTSNKREMPDSPKKPA